VEIGALIEIGGDRHVIIDKFWVGYEMFECDLQKEYYYETFSMASNCNRKRTAIACDDFKAGLEEGNIKILSRPRESRVKIPSGTSKNTERKAFIQTRVC